METRFKTAWICRESNIGQGNREKSVTYVEPLSIKKVFDLAIPVSLQYLRSNLDSLVRSSILPDRVFLAL